VDNFLRKYSGQFHKRITGMSASALAVLHGYPWPGNVRELENMIERAVALSNGPVIELADLPLELTLGEHAAVEVGGGEALPLAAALERLERQIVLRVLEQVQWNQTRAARLLGLHRNSLRIKLASWGIRQPPGDADPRGTAQ
jgi:two-component system response regulator AtoC